MATIKQTVERNCVLAEVPAEQLKAITGGSIDVDVPQCGNVFPHGPYRSLVALLVPAVLRSATRVARHTKS